MRPRNLCVVDSNQIGRRKIKKIIQKNAQILDACETLPQKKCNLE
jgi:hypothetical protein